MTKNNWDVSRLIEETDKLYSRIIMKRPEADKLSFTKSKIISERGWEPSRSLIDSNFNRVLSELKIFYVPNILLPGPAFVFPIRDVDGTYPYAQTKPLEGSVLYSPKAKYYRIGNAISSPQWLGNSPETIKILMRMRRVMVVEGPFDLLACRLLCPSLPVLCPLTKLVTKKHEEYLRILGVKTLHLMFDNELSKKTGGFMGSGNISMAMQKKSITSMKVEIALCPASDPSEALQSMKSAMALRKLLNSEFEVSAPTSAEFEE